VKTPRFSEGSLVFPGLVLPRESGTLVLVRLLRVRTAPLLFEFEGAALFDEGLLDAKRSLLLL
jgi:hypothetical protein